MFETERLIISIPGRSLAESAVRFYIENKDEAERWDPPLPEYFTTIEYQRERLDEDVEGFDDGFETRFWIFLKENENIPIGYCLVQRVIRTEYQASCIIGYFLDERYRHQGYMSEALGFVLELLFFDYKMQRVCAYIVPENEPSVRLAENLGFSREGLTKSYSFLHDRWTDHYCYSLIRPPRYGFLDPQ